MDYKQAGVDIAKGERIVQRIKTLMGEAGKRIGHFGGAMPFPMSGYRKPLLVSSIDGLGTKGAVAAVLGRYEGVGRDLVHHSINDIAVCGAEPLFFLDYVAMAALDEEVVMLLVRGMNEACARWEVALVGGETAEMPGVYQPSEFDLVGTITGIVEQDGCIDGRTVGSSDILVGFPSVGLHTNGFTLARRVFRDAGIGYERNLPELEMTVGEALLAEHRCYLDEIRVLKKDYAVKGLAHITGGGLPGNVVRIIPKGLRAEVNWGSWSEPAIFGVIRSLGKVPEDDMRRTFNLGIGLVAALDPVVAKQALAEFPESLVKPVRVGMVVPA